MSSKNEKNFLNFNLSESERPERVKVKGVRNDLKELKLRE